MIQAGSFEIIQMNDDLKTFVGAARNALQQPRWSTGIDDHDHV